MGSTEHQRQIIDTFVNSVYVFDDRVVLNFNFTDDAKTVTREEVFRNESAQTKKCKSKDAIQMVDYRNNERCSKYQRGQTKDYKDIVALIERNKDNALNIASPTMISVALRETDVMIGEIVVMPNDGTISLGYTFSYKVHRSGYAYEALSSFIEYLHKHYPQWDFICFTERENIPSMSLLKKLGYTNLGYLPSKNSQVFGKWLRQDTLEEITSAVR